MADRVTYESIPLIDGWRPLRPDEMTGPGDFIMQFDPWTFKWKLRLDCPIVPSNYGMLPRAWDMSVHPCRKAGSRHKIATSPLPLP